MSLTVSPPGRRTVGWSIGWLALTLAIVIAANAQEPTPPFQVSRLEIDASKGRFEFQVELAVTPAERTRGLMFRESLADDHGMLFDFGVPQPVAMWMRNTYIPLDMLFVGADGRISQIAANAEPLSDKVIASNEPVRAVLELRGGITGEIGIKPGDRIIHPLFGKP
jgi:uncharacterized membrane protein (UPF0127 family)